MTTPFNLDEAFRRKFPSSAKLFKRALNCFPSGVTHDARYLRPFPVYVERAQGSKKWDVDGNELIDYWVGHGALLLGHQRPEVIEAVHAQLAKGTHYGACHELEIEWAEQVQKLMPSIERIRFTSSGTEATLMAVRLARAFTGRPKMVKFAGHFHGWQDHLAMAVHPPYDDHETVGMVREVVADTLVLPPNDIKAVTKALKAGDVAGVILEPSGGGFGDIPTREGFLQELRAATQKHGAVLIFDEVVTGFRWAPGGAQEFYGVTPDLTTLAKILAGGLPGGAVGGREDIMARLAFADTTPLAKDDPTWNQTKKISHPGTFNANPLSAAAGIATLKIVAKGEAIRKASEAAAAIRKGYNEAIDKRKLAWCAFGSASEFKVLMNHGCKRRKACDFRVCDYDWRKLKGNDPKLVRALRCAMLLGGCDIPHGGRGLTSSAHSATDVQRTVAAFDAALDMLKKAGLV
ncbi:MAG: aspartate aminotransferase family protein [Planctomycetes bacterium]|nr:aspartate aminotransferase family protein [Planctomycetota bacterium]